jgi:hypothetical protein
MHTILNEAGVVTTNIAEEQVPLLTHDVGPNMSNKECPVDMLQLYTQMGNHLYFDLK